jgi:hypothetical protein
MSKYIIGKKGRASLDTIGYDNNDDTAFWLANFRTNFMTEGILRGQKKDGWMDIVVCELTRGVVWHDTKCIEHSAASLYFPFIFLFGGQCWSKTWPRSVGELVFDRRGEPPATVERGE